MKNSKKHRDLLLWLRHFGCVVATISLVGCGGYDKVGPTTYEFAKALYSITNQKSTELLSTVSEKIEEALANDEITPQEAEWLSDIVEQARNDDWQAANAAARSLMEAQIE